MKSLGKLLIIFAVTSVGCSSGRDWDLIGQQDIPSPDGKMVATIFEMTGYNTTGTEPQVSVLKPGQKPGANGNVVSGGPGDLFDVHWLNSTSLVVEYFRDPTRDSFRDSTNVNGVHVLLKRVSLHTTNRWHSDR